jgi:hypothetical protein
VTQFARPTAFRSDNIIRFAVDDRYELCKRTLHILEKETFTPEDEEVVRQAFRLLQK